MPALLQIGSLEYFRLDQSLRHEPNLKEGRLALDPSVLLLSCRDIMRYDKHEMSLMNHLLLHIHSRTPISVAFYYSSPRPFSRMWRGLLAKSKLLKKTWLPEVLMHCQKYSCKKKFARSTHANIYSYVEFARSTHAEKSLPEVLMHCQKYSCMH